MDGEGDSEAELSQSVGSMYDGYDDEIEEILSSDDGDDSSKVMNAFDLTHEMSRTVYELCDLTRAREADCRALLQKTDWDKERAIENFINEDTDAAGEGNPNPHAVEHGDEDGALCCVCFTETDGLSGLDECGHMACEGCWGMYLRNKITEDNTSEIKCIGGCKLLLDDLNVFRYMEDAEVLEKYQRLKTGNYVQTNSKLHWCPGVDCENAVKVMKSGAVAAKCSCGTRFCTECHEEWHEPLTCKQLKLWEVAVAEDKASKLWINSNAKDCSRCKSPIEKNGGCNHMTCAKCGYEFCWVCLDVWHHHHQCNRVNNASAQSSNTSLAQLIHYSERYMNHKNSLKLEKKLFSVVENTIRCLQNRNRSNFEVQFLWKAVEVLSQCRRTIMYSYAFAYYLSPGNNRVLFEDNQGDLELATEELSSLLENKMDYSEHSVIMLMQQVQDKYRFVNDRRRALLSFCNENELEL